jgi:aldose 1-epimerase
VTELSVPASAARLTLDENCGGAVSSLTFDLKGKPVDVLCPDPGHAAADRVPHDERDRMPPPTDRCTHPFFAGRFLWPFNDRIPGGRYTFAGATFILPANDPESDDAIHGMLYRRQVQVQSGIDTAAVVLTDTIAPDEYESYPFHMTIRVELRLAARTLDLTMSSRNEGALPAPVAFGWHPYFQLPGAHLADLVLSTSAGEDVPVDAELLPTGGSVSIEGTALAPFAGAGAVIGATEIDVAVRASGESIRTEIRGNGIGLKIEQDGAFAYQQWFTPPDRSSVAIEPITAATDSFNRPEVGQRVLEPGESIEGSMTVSLVA